MKTLLIPIAVSLLLVPDDGRPKDKKQAKLPFKLALVPEMQAFPDLKAGSPVLKDAARDHVAAARAAWQKAAPALQKRITPDVARSLSRWAKKQMEKYKKVPPLKDAAWTPVRSQDRGRRLLLEATLDTLPSHSPIVTRWLRAYLLYDVARKAVVRVTVTIRGQILE